MYELLLLFTLLQCSIAIKPNIFLVLVDDFGWANVGYHRNDKEVQTPTIDKLVSQGIKLERHYTYNYCSPSRASLQTGRLPVHVSFFNDDPTLHNPQDKISGYAGIPTKMTGIASKLKQAGYATHMTGKWDAGMATCEHTPMGRGYDSFFGYFHHANDYYMMTLGSGTKLKEDICAKHGMQFVDLWNNTQPAYHMNGTGTYEEDLFTENTLNVIRMHDMTKPLFLFHSFHIVHTPLQIPRKHEELFSFIQNDDRRKYAAMVSYMDTAIDSFVNALKSKGMWDNTLMVLSSDNGGPIYGSSGILSKQYGHTFGGANNMPLRGGKLSNWEGGIRVNAFVSGGFVPPVVRGTVNENYIHIADWYATFCAIAGINSTDTLAMQYGLPKVDSINMWPSLIGKNEVDSTPFGPRNEIHVATNCLIQGKYKLIRGGFEQLGVKQRFLNHFIPMDGYWPGYGFQASLNSLTKLRNCKNGCLFNIRDDPFEKVDLAKATPIPMLGRRLTTDSSKVLESMKHRLEELNKSVFKPNRGVMSLDACNAAIQYGGYYGPFVNQKDCTFK